MYSKGHASDNRVLNNMRNNFVSNVSNNNSYENLPTRRYSLSDEDESFEFHNTSHSGLTGNRQPYNNTKLNRQSTISESQDTVYELEPLPLHNDSRPKFNEYQAPASQVAENPFLGSSREYENMNTRDNPMNPFDDHADRAMGHPMGYPMDYPMQYNKPQPPISEESSKVRSNEKARLRQLRRNSKYHFSKFPYVTAVVTLIQVIVFIVELVRMAQLTGSAFQTRPYFNPMLGPSTYVLINMGARYVPCMQSIRSVTDDPSINFPCPNSTTTESNVCPLSELCGMSGIHTSSDGYQPDQWYRVITPIFLHAGFLHIIFNLLLQVTMGPIIEQYIGSIKFFIIYFASGILGFLLGANFAPNGIASTGASGALFGIVATNIVMFIYCGKKNTNIYGTKKYALFLCIMVGEIVVSFVLGLLPGLDNFSHIGGFASGLLLSIVLLPDPFFVYVDGIITYNGDDNTWQQVTNKWNPFYHMDDKITYVFYIWCCVRVVALVLAIVFFALLIRNFFSPNDISNKNSCDWCKYINCIPVHEWCDMGEVTVENVSSGPSDSGNQNNEGPPSSPGNSNGNNQKARREVFSAFSGDVSNESQYLNQPISHYITPQDPNGIALGITCSIFFLTFYYIKRRNQKD